MITGAELKPKGYKILLEVLGKGTWERDKEIPFEFSDREIGTSKLKIKTIIEYAGQVADITLYSFTHHQSAAWREWKRIFKFGIVGLSGIVVNLVILISLVEQGGISVDLSGPIATECAIISNFILNDLWTFRAFENQTHSNRWWRLVAFNVVSAGGALINIGIYLFLIKVFAVYYPLAQFIGILFGFIWNLTMNRRFTWTRI